MNLEKIDFNQPHLTGKETKYIKDAVASKKLSGNGKYTQLCQQFFEDRYRIKKCFLTTSCTDALEMCAILLNIQAGDEVIMPAYTFVSTANAFVSRGAKVVFVDSKTEHPNMDETKVESLISPKTKAIVVVHYAGVACEMDTIMSLANKHHLFVVEDAAQAVESIYKGKALGSIGHLSAFSFHETKNIISGEGGMLGINDEQSVKRAEIIWEKGTNRAAFWRGEIDKYNWVDVGSSFLPSEIIAAFLYAQLEEIDGIQHKRITDWNRYHLAFQTITNKVRLPEIFNYSTNNAHIYYLICNSVNERDELIAHLKSHNISAVFHYISLHESPYYLKTNANISLPNAEFFSDCLVRLPLFFGLTEQQQQRVVDEVIRFYNN